MPAAGISDADRGPISFAFVRAKCSIARSRLCQQGRAPVNRTTNASWSRRGAAEKGCFAQARCDRNLSKVAWPIARIGVREQVNDGSRPGFEIRLHRMRGDRLELRACR